MDVNASARHCIPTVMQMDAAAIDVTRPVIGEAPRFRANRTESTVGLAL